ncbi:uncharacterized protein LOC130738439 [Lotus japonicus]|uniref:uncharacterized protein LOC130738439 n=1 Tax=Lotus japonicus TaxID=34305 RepID=UPI0025901D65|nr:uncharacterized protein LOC130738439 [Lotus japonicus]
MADQRNHHQHRPHRLSVPPRTTTFSATPRPPYTPFRYPPSSTPTPTPSKHRLSFNSKSKSKPSLSFLFLLLLLSLRSLYSLLPFLRSSPPSFSLFPFSFLVSLLSFSLTLSFSLFPSKSKHNQPTLFSSISPSQQRVLVFKSILLSLVFLLRFQALLYCTTAAMILAEFMGTVAARALFRRKNHSSNGWRGFASLFLGLSMLSFGWDRIECFPFSKLDENCVRIWPLLLPFVSGFLGCYEQRVSDWGNVKQLGHKRVRLITLLFTTIVLFVPAVISFFVFEEKSDKDSVSFANLAWPLANTVVFGVLLSENCYSGGESWLSFKDSQREFLVTFVCTLVLELFYFPDLSLWGLLLCGVLLYVAVRDLDPFRSNELGIVSGEESSELLSDMIMKPVRHILSERKSRKIALFLLINAGYMVVEFAAGFMSNSLGLISDACHMLFDCAALAIGLYASYISRLPANNHYNYGRGRFEVLSGYANAVFLVLVGALIVVESFERILEPQEISTNSLLVVSIGGLVVNVIGLIFFHEEHHHAHGLSGSCSHSHSHSHTESHSHHPQQHHDHVHCGGKHHHERHGSNQEFISVSSDCQDNLCSGNSTGHHNHSDHERKAERHADNYSIHGDGHCHDHHEHDAHGHDHHHHTSHHDHCSHEGKTECLADSHSIQSSKGHDHARQHDHRDHDHHDHASHHNHNQHHHLDLADSHSIQSSKGHDHARQHDHRDHDHHDHASHHDHKHHHHLDTDHHSHDASVVHKEHSHRHIDHNMEGIFLHVLADTLGSVGVVISTLLIKYKGWLIADPACSIFISILIISSVIPLLRNSAEILLQRVPRVQEHELKDSLTKVSKIRGVYGIPKFHLWSFTNSDIVGTLHLHVSTDTDKMSVKSQVSQLLNNAGIKDVTLQVECVR